jgi:protein-disulfide isomerase
MRLKTLIALILLIAMPACASAAPAKVDWKIQSALQLQEAPVDIQMSRNGEWFYVLTDSGHLLIYSSEGIFNGRIEVGQAFDQVAAGPTEDTLFLSSRRDKRIETIEVSYTLPIDISGSPFRGPADAPVVIVEYTDFQCPYCARLTTILDQMMQLFPDKLKIVYKSFPLSSHKYSWQAATAAMAAQEKGKFWEFYKQLFANYNLLNEAKIKEIRQKLGLDTPDFDVLMNSAPIRSKVASDRQEGINMGVDGTPTVFINGKRLKNKRPEGFTEAIEKVLKASNS